MGDVGSERHRKSSTQGTVGSWCCTALAPGGSTSLTSPPSNPHQLTGIQVAARHTNGLASSCIASAPTASFHLDPSQIPTSLAIDRGGLLVVVLLPVSSSDIYTTSSCLNCRGRRRGHGHRNIILANIRSLREIYYISSPGLFFGHARLFFIIFCGRTNESLRSKRAFSTGNTWPAGTRQCWIVVGV